MKSFLKINSLVILGLLSMCLSMTSCGKDTDEPKKENEKDVAYWDIVPIDFVIEIRDTQGHNLLNPANDGNFYGKDIEVEYGGNYYTVDWDGYAAANKSRAIPEVFEGLKINSDPRNPESNRLAFGEFSPTRNLDFSIKLSLPGYDKKYDIRLVNKFTRDEYWQEVEIDRCFYLDGESCGPFPVKIVLPALAE